MTADFECIDRVVSAMDVAAMVDSELTVYGAVGAVFVFLFLALFLGLVFHGPCQSLDKFPHQSPGDNLQLDHQGESGCPEAKCSSPGPPVIYTEQLARDMGDAVNLLDVGVHYSHGANCSGDSGLGCGARRAASPRISSNASAASVWYNHVLPSVSRMRCTDNVVACPSLDVVRMKTIDLQIDGPDDYYDDNATCCQSSDDFKQMEAAFQRMMRQPIDGQAPRL